MELKKETDRSSSKVSELVEMQCIDTNFTHMELHMSMFAQRHSSFQAFFLSRLNWVHHAWFEE